jgi:hypothetical protein
MLTTSTTTKQNRADCAKAGAADGCSLAECPAVMRRELCEFDDETDTTVCSSTQEPRCR